MPTYQEAANINELLTQLRGVTDADVLVVDDASPDGTADIAASCDAALGGVFVLRRHGKTGLGDAYLAGFAWALERPYEVVVGMDADLSHDPALVPTLIGLTDEAAVVIGSRYIAGGSTPDWPLRRRLLSVWANRYASKMLRLSINDVTSGFRAYRADLLRTLDLQRIRAEGYAFLVEMADVAVQSGASVRETPICFRDREHGKSKMSLRVVAESMFLVTRWGIQRRLRGAARRPQSVDAATK